MELILDSAYGIAQISHSGEATDNPYPGIYSLENLNYNLYWNLFYLLQCHRLSSMMFDLIEVQLELYCRAMECLHK